MVVAAEVVTVIVGGGVVVVVVSGYASYICRLSSAFDNFHKITYDIAFDVVQFLSVVW